jgi:enoyl-CoA hydratase/carnithine racemase
MSFTCIIAERVGTEKNVGLITLNRPNALNSLSRQLLLELSQALHEFDDDPKINVIVLTGAGKAFCAGMDLKG